MEDSPSSKSVVGVIIILLAIITAIRITVEVKSTHPSPLTSKERLVPKITIVTTNIDGDVVTDTTYVYSLKN